MADNQGLSDLAYIICHAPAYLNAKGALFLEHGWQQANAVQSLFRENGWVEIQSMQDYGGQDRITKAEQAK